MRVFTDATTVTRWASNEAIHAHIGWIVAKTDPDLYDDLHIAAEVRKREAEDTGERQTLEEFMAEGYREMAEAGGWIWDKETSVPPERPLQSCASTQGGTMSKKAEPVAVNWLLWDQTNSLVHATGTEEDVTTAKTKLASQPGHDYDLYVVPVYPA